jgi:hypothetical protein
MSGECDPILVAGDDGEVLDESADGAVACVADGDGMTVRLDPESELGERLTWLAGHRGESPDALLADAIREQLDEMQTDGGRDRARFSPLASESEVSDAEWCAKYHVPASDCIFADGGGCPHDSTDEPPDKTAETTSADGGPTVRCPNGHEFDREEAASATFDGDEARWQCPDCGAWVEGPPPGGER